MVSIRAVLNTTFVDARAAFAQHTTNVLPHLVARDKGTHGYRRLGRKRDIPDTPIKRAKHAWPKADVGAAVQFGGTIDRAAEYLNNAPRKERGGWVVKFSGVKPEHVATILRQFSNELHPSSLSADIYLAALQNLATAPEAPSDGLALYETGASR